MFKKIILVLIVIALLGGAYGYFFMYNKSHPDYEHMKADLSISAEKLFTDCRDAGLAAEYTGKLLEVSGVPTSMEQNDSSWTAVFVFDEGMFGPEGVRATFLNHFNKDLSENVVGKEMTIKAYCTGYNDTDVVLEKASIAN